MATDNKSKADYLKRYLSAEPEEKEKKKRKKKKSVGVIKLPRVKVVDDDIDTHSLIPKEVTIAQGQEDSEEEAPTIAQFVDERPEAVKNLEVFQQDGRWKVLADTTVENISDEHAQLPQLPRQRNDSDSDESPTRQGRSGQTAGQTTRNQSHSDKSAHGKHRPDSDSDRSPVRKQRHDSDSDGSPIRKRIQDSDSDRSPVRKQRHDSDSDQSPTRKHASKQTHASDSDQSPVRKLGRKQTHGSDSDQSPARIKRHNSDSDQSPVRKNRHHSSSSDDSSHNKNNRSESGMSLSKRTKKSTSSPKQSRWQARADSDSDQSPPRKKCQDGDSSPQRRRTTEESGSRPVPPPQQLSGDVDDLGRNRTMASGAKAGLSSAKDMRQESTELKRKEKDFFSKLGKDVLGKDAKTVFRDKSGRRRNLKAEEAEDAEKAAKKAALDQKYAQWGKGLKQKEEIEANVQAALHEATKPLARGRDDQDLDREMREQERDGDPMLAFMRRKQSKSNNKKPDKPRYKGPEPPPNRFGILPGYRWDGVNRSNGFEAKYFATLADRQATKDVAYKWNVEDM